MSSAPPKSIFHQLAAYLPLRRVSAETTVSRHALEKVVKSGTIRTIISGAGKTRVNVEDLAVLFPNAQARRRHPAPAAASRDE